MPIVNAMRAPVPASPAPNQTPVAPMQPAIVQTLEQPERLIMLPASEAPQPVLEPTPNSRPQLFEG